MGDVRADKPIGYSVEMATVETVLFFVVLALVWVVLVIGPYVFVKRVFQYPECAEKLLGFRRPERWRKR